MPVTMGTPWYCPGIPVVSFPRRVPAFALFSLFLPKCAKGGRKRETQRALVIYRVCTGVLRRRFLMDYLFRALLSPCGIGLGIVHSYCRRRRTKCFRVELPAILSSNVP